MIKKHQIFVSSTFLDLQREREIALDAILRLEHLPSGMELFPSTHDDPLKYIKRVIDDCDYYLLIVGGRYGSTAEDGISYTEKEFDYALAKGLPIVACVRQDIAVLPAASRETDPTKAAALERFRGLLKFDEFSHSLRVYEVCGANEKWEWADAWCRCDE